MAFPGSLTDTLSPPGKPLSRTQLGRQAGMAVCVAALQGFPGQLHPTFIFSLGFLFSHPGSTSPLLPSMWRDGKKPLPEGDSWGRWQKIPVGPGISLRNLEGRHQSQSQHSFEASRPALRSP